MVATVNSQLEPFVVRKESPAGGWTLKASLREKRDAIVATINELLGRGLRLLRG
jgi:hypothetical protein